MEKTLYIHTEDEILIWFYTLDNERQNDLIIEAHSDPTDVEFYLYINAQYGAAIKKYLETH